MTKPLRNPQQVNVQLKYKCLLNASSEHEYVARGAATLGAHGQPGFIAVYQYLYGGSELNVKKVGFIIVQVKTNPNEAQFINKIFQEMDPFGCNLIDNLDKRGWMIPYSHNLACLLTCQR